MRNSMRQTNGTRFVDTTVVEPITDGLFASPTYNYLAMPIHPQYPDKDVTIPVYHNNNSRHGQFPDTEYIRVVRNILPDVNEKGFNTHAEAEHVQAQIAAQAQTHSTETLVKDCIIVNSNDRYYILPAFD